MQVAIVDALERRICIYCERKELRREVAKLWSPEEAEAIAKWIARKLTEEHTVAVRIAENCAGKAKAD